VPTASEIATPLLSSTAESSRPASAQRARAWSCNAKSTAALRLASPPAYLSRIEVKPCSTVDLATASTVSVAVASSMASRDLLT
jgi:hypothetical protein